MSFQPFSDELVEFRAARIPATLDAENRARFIARLTAAAKQQAAIAAQSDAGLRTTGEIVVIDDVALIRHEPAAPLLPGRVLQQSNDERPDITTLIWLTQRVFSALAAAASQNVIHGGIQLAALYRDHLGLVKLGDSGVGAAYEATLGVAARRQLHCESATLEVGGRRAWGCWSLLAEGEPREEGWIAPYFGHELLDGRARLNARSDQFAAALALFLIACGKHPFGAEMSDPSLLFYFHLDPDSPAEGREDWRAVYERATGDVSQSLDKPILAWTQLIHKACASDPGQRFPNAAEAFAAVSAIANPDWARAACDLQGATAALDGGNAEEFLRLATPWAEGAALPALWSTPLREWVQRVDAEKEVIARRKRLEQKLAEAQRAFHLSELSRSRELALEVAGGDFDELRSGALALQAQIGELEDFINSGADEVAQAYLDAAREQIARSDMSEARQVLTGVLGDPAMPATRKSQAHDLLAQIELQEQTAQRQLDELTGALDDLRRGRYAAVERRLSDLMGERGVPAPVAQQAEMLLIETRRARAEHERLAEIVGRGREAWERGEEVGLDSAITELPEALSDTSIAEARADLSERLAGLRAALSGQEEAQKRFEAGDLEAALQTLTAANTEMAPQAVRDAMEVHAGLIREAQAEIVRERRREAEAALVEARHRLEQLDLNSAEQALADRALEDAAVDVAMREEAARLRRHVSSAGRVLRALEHAQGDLEDGDFVSGLRIIASLEIEGLPLALRERCAELRQALQASQKAAIDAERARFDGLLIELNSAIGSGNTALGHELQSKLESTKHLDDPRVAARAAAIDSLSSAADLAAAIEAAERAIATGDEIAAAETLKRLGEPRPRWAQERVKLIRERVERLADERRAAALHAVQTTLDAAEQALAECDLEKGLGQLESVAGGAELAPELQRRRDALTAQAEQLRSALETVAGLEQEARSGDLLRARQAIAAATATLPPNLKERLQAAAKVCDQRLVEERAAIDTELEKLAVAIAKRGRRARSAPARLARLVAAPFAAQEQVARATALLSEYEATPIPTVNFTPWIAGGVAAGVIGLAALFYLRDVSPRDPEVPLPPTPGEVEPEIVQVDPPAHSPALPVGPAPRAPEVVEATPEPAKPTPQPEAAPVQEESPLSFTEAAEALEVELLRQLGAEVVVDLAQDERGQVVTRVRWRERDLPEMSGPDFDVKRGAFGESAGSIADRFRPLIEALALATAGKLQPAVDEAHDAMIEWVTPQKLATVEHEGAGGAIVVTCPAKLRGDPRSAAQFMLTGTLESGRVLADDVSRQAFGELLAGLRRQRLDEGIRAAHAEVGAHASFRLMTEERADPGDAPTLRLISAAARQLAEGTANWSPETLMYEIRVDGLRRAARESFGAWVAQESISLAPHLLNQAQPPADHIGAQLWPTLAPSTPTLAVTASDVPWTATVSFPFEDGHGLTIHVRAVVGLDAEGGLQLLNSQSMAVSKSVSDQLAALNRDGEFRRRRAGLALSAAAISEAGAVIDVAGAGLIVATRDGRKHLGQWDEQRLAWGPLTLAPPPAPEPAPQPPVAPSQPPIAIAQPRESSPPGQAPPVALGSGNVDETLRSLSATAAPDASLFAAALFQVTQAKAATHNWDGYGPSASFEGGGDGRARLIGLSSALQRMVAPNPQIDPYPTVFLEHYVGAVSVWALSWRVQTDASDNIRDVAGLQAWEVMPTARLQGLNDTPRLIRAFADDAALGEALLGRALGPVIEGSAKSGDGAFGVLISPDERLWLARWDQVTISPRRVQSVGMRDADDPGEASSLRTLLRPKQRTNDVRYRRAGVWLAPSLAGAAKRDVNGMQLTLGSAGGKALVAKFKSLGGAGYAALVAPDISGGFGRAEFERGARLNEIGFRFWNEKWVGDAWQPNSFVSYCLAQAGP